MASIRDGHVIGLLSPWCGCRREAGQPSYLYYFRHSTPTQRGPRPGGLPCQRAAIHLRTGRQVRGAWTELAAAPAHHRGITALGRAMLSYWVSFVRDGVPTASNMPAWPRFTARGSRLSRY